MIARALLVALLIAFAGCVTRGPVDLPKEVLIEVPVSCIKETIARPSFITDRELAAADDYTFVLELAADRLRRRQYEAKLEAAIAGCR